MTKTILTVVIASTFLSCDKPEEMQAELLCTPGQSDACACENGLEGAQVCLEDGMSYGECTCEEPAPACAPGEMDACVCDGQELGMRECGEDEAFGECVCETDSGNSEHIPGTQWVLRDKDGKAVPAIFEPVCPEAKQEQCGTSWDEKSYPCVFIHYLDDNPIWISYDLGTGTPHACYQDGSKWPQGSEIIYDNSECKGLPYRIKMLPWEGPSGDGLEFVDGKLYRIDMSKPGQNLAKTWKYSGPECETLELPENLDLWKFEELPMDMMSVLGNAPYSISIE